MAKRKSGHAFWVSAVRVAVVIVLGAAFPDDAAAQSFAYAANRSSDNVSVINTGTDAVVGAVPVGDVPVGVAIIPDGTEAYVANSASNNVSVISTTSKAVIATIPVGSGPGNPAVNPNGTRVYVPNRMSGDVSVIDVATHMVIATIPGVGEVRNVALSPDGSRAYLARANGNAITVINTATDAVMTTIPVGGSSLGIAITPDGKSAYVSLRLANRGVVAVVSTDPGSSDFHTVKTNIQVADLQSGNLSAVAVTPDGSRVYVVNDNSNSLHVINVASSTVTTLSPGASDPQSIAITSEGNKAYLTSTSNLTKVIDTNPSSPTFHTVLGTVVLGSGPSGIAVTPALPTISLALTGCTVCRPGDTFAVTATVRNPTRKAVPVEIKAGVMMPDGSHTNISVLNDTHFEMTLAPGFDVTVQLLQAVLPAALATGTWAYEATLISPALGRPLARDTKIFGVSLMLPTLASIMPVSGGQGLSVPVTLTGTGFVAGVTTVAISGTGVTAGTVNVASATHLTTTLTIDAGAETGGHNVTVAVAGGTSDPVTFTVLPAPTLYTMNPAFGLAGTAVPITITGADFVPGATTLVASGADVTVAAVSVVNTTTLTAVLMIPAGATSGFRDVRVTTAGGSSNTLRLVLGCAIAPISGLPGTTVPVTVTAAGFIAGSTTLTIGGTGITIGGVNVRNATTLTATLTIAGNAPAGGRSITVRTGSSSASVIFWVPATQVADRFVHVPPDYYSFLPPDKGNSYVDPVFGSTIKRMSHASSSSDIAFSSGNLYSSGSLPFISTEYSTMSPFNSDNSQILALHFSYFGLYHGLFDLAGNFIKDLPFAISASTEPRWSRTSPYELYFVNDNQLKKFNVVTDTVSVVHTFTEHNSIGGKGESDISFDGDHFVFAGDERSIFVYEISTDTKGFVFDTGGRPYDSLYITPDNNVTVTWLAAGTARYNGIELFDRNMNFLRQVARAGGHMDVTRDTNGEEVLVWANAGDPQATCPNAVVKIRLSTGQQTCLLELDWSLALHISGTDNSGWFFMDTYAPGDPSPASTDWKPFTNEILAVKLDGTEVRRLAHHRSRPFDDYNYTPRASASRDGSRFVFTSNYGLQSILGYPALYSDIYLVVLPTQ